MIKIKITDRRDPRALASQVPHHNIEVVAAFGEDHGGRFGFTPPTAAHETVGHMPMGDVFAVSDGDDIANFAGLE